jgi:lipopolysaccharide assembly protein A
MSRPEHPTARPGRKLGTKQIVALVVAAVTLIFILQNRDTVQITFFALTVTAALWFVLLIVLVLGVVIGALATRRK